MSARGAWEYANFCLGAPFSAPICRAFWTWLIIVLSLVALVLLLAIIWRQSSRWLRRQAALKAQAQREAVNHDEILAVRWKEESEH